MLWAGQLKSGTSLESLFEQSMQIEFQFRHIWQKNDLIMWDNRIVLNFVVQDHADEPTHIHRLQVERPTPILS
ncbi:MAG TPA: hypothetical protein DEQ32_08800 [Gammaproteobacteria bacterium]|nr:hypothetical protein [Gammaproteobacteria bacterium]